jgi:hypothetical protein
MQSFNFCIDCQQAKRSSPYNELKVFRQIALFSLVRGDQSGVYEDSKSSAVLRRVARQVLTDVSKEPGALLFRFINAQ